MKTGTKLFQFKSGKVKRIVEEFYEEKKSMGRAARKFSKSVGGLINFFVMHTEDGARVSGIAFDERPDPKLWRVDKEVASCHKGKRLFCCVPKKNSKEGRILYDKYASIPRASFDDLKKQVNWSWVCYDNRIAGFNFFNSANKKFSGFSLPEIKGKLLPADINLSGCKEISYKVYEKHMGAGS